jgi:hypothetical protein
VLLGVLLGLVLGVAGVPVVVLGEGVGVLVVGELVVGFAGVGVPVDGGVAGGWVLADGWVLAGGWVLADGLPLAVGVVPPGGVVASVALELGVPLPALVSLGDGAAHGGLGVLGVAVGSGDAVQGVSGRNGFPTGRGGLAVERDVPSVRSAGEPNVLVDCGTWLDAESRPPNGTKNQTPVRRTAAAASAPNLRRGSCRRLCRGRD